MCLSVLYIFHLQYTVWSVEWKVLNISLDIYAHSQDISMIYNARNSTVSIAQRKQQNGSLQCVQNTWTFYKAETWKDQIMAFLPKRFYLIKITRNLSNTIMLKQFLTTLIIFAGFYIMPGSILSQCLRIVWYSGVTLEFRQWWAPDRIFRCTNSFRIFFRGFQRKFSKRTFTGFFQDAFMVKT